MRKLLLFFTLISCSISISAQRSRMFYENKSDSSVSNYLVVYPKKEVKALLVLLPGFGEYPEDVFFQSGIPKQAAKQGILTIIPTFKTGTQSFKIDEATQTELAEFLIRITKALGIENEKFFIGGFSIGGSGAVKYAESANKKSGIKKPDAVFAIDPPLDFERLYNSMERNIRITPSGKSPSKENEYFIKRIEAEMGGTPDISQEKYFLMSPYSVNDTAQKAIKNLVSTPIMIISEPDIEWILNERHSDFYSMNALDCAAFINELKQLGNKNAVLTITKNKGFRKPQNMRNPHSWSIASPKETIKWLNGFN